LGQQQQIRFYARVGTRHGHSTALADSCGTRKSYYYAVCIAVGKDQHIRSALLSSTWLSHHISCNNYINTNIAS